MRVRTADAETLDAVVVGFDPARDLAPLYGDAPSIDAVRIGDTEPGRPVSIVGRPTSEGLRLLDTTVGRAITATGR